MRTAALLVIAVALTVVAQGDRGDLQFSVGGGVWMPALFDEDSHLSPGPAFSASLQIPPALGNCFIIETGYLMAGCDRETWDGISGVPLTIGWRLYPFYRRFAGPRGIEPILGAYGGGMILWDSPTGTQEKTTSGAGIIGAEIGARVSLGGEISMDITVRPEWIPAGSNLAGQAGKDLSGIRVLASVVF